MFRDHRNGEIKYARIRNLKQKFIEVLYMYVLLSIYRCKLAQYDAWYR